MEEIFNKKEGELYNDIKELFYQIMLSETKKTSIENEYLKSQLTGNTASIHSNKESAERSLLAADKKGFTLSLAYKELMLKNGYKRASSDIGLDAAEEWAENMLSKHGLIYPRSWTIDYEDRHGLNFKYFKSDRINELHNNFINAVEKIKLNEFDKKRIMLIAEYYKKSRLLLTKYHNHEEINNQDKEARVK